MRALSTWCAVVVFAVVGCASSANAPSANAPSDKVSSTEKLALLGGAKIEAIDAIKTALGKAPGRVVDTELRSKNGKTVWEIDIASSDSKLTEVDVDASTGTIADSE